MNISYGKECMGRWDSKWNKSKMSQGVPRTWQTFPYSLKTIHSVTTHFPSKVPHSISGSFYRLSHSFLFFPFSSVQWDPVPPVQTISSFQGQDHRTCDRKRSQIEAILHLPFIVATHPSCCFCPYHL